MPKLARGGEVRRLELPDTLKRSGPKAQRTFAKTHDAAVEQYGEGERAHRTAMASLKHTHEKRGGRWVPKDGSGPSDPRSRKTTAQKRRGEGEKLMHEQGDPMAHDAALIAAAQRVEHYEIAAYGTARQLAGDCGYDGIKDLMDQTLDEESNADKLLTKIATGGMFKAGINQEATV